MEDKSPSVSYNTLCKSLCKPPSAGSWEDIPQKNCWWFFFFFSPILPTSLLKHILLTGVETGYCTRQTLVCPCAEVSTFYGGAKSCEICWCLRMEVSYKLSTHIGALLSLLTCLLSLKCFEPHVKFQLDGMEPSSQLAAQKKVQEENLLDTRRYFEKGIV